LASVARWLGLGLLGVVVLRASVGPLLVAGWVVGVLLGPATLVMSSLWWVGVQGLGWAYWAYEVLAPLFKWALTVRW